MDTTAEPLPLKPKRKYKPRVQCTDPNLKYRYKPKPGPKKGFKTARKQYTPERTDAEQRRFSRYSAHQKKFSSDPAVIAARTAHLKDLPHNGRRGIPDGMNAEQAEAAWAVARDTAEKVFNNMVEQGIVADVTPEDFEATIVERVDGTKVTVLVPKTDGARASAALKEACVMALGPGAQAARLAAIRTVLEYTKAKPATKIDASVSKAEDWLAAVTADALKDDGK